MLLAASIVFTYYTTWAILLVSWNVEFMHGDPVNLFFESHSLTLRVRYTTISQPVNGRFDSPPSSLP